VNRRLFWLSAALLAACSPPQEARSFKGPKGKVTAVGSAHVRLSPPQDKSIAIDGSGRPSTPRISEGARGGVTSNDWWSSLIYAQNQQSVESLPLYAHPLVLQTHVNGFGVSYPDRPILKKSEYMFRHDEDFVVGLRGLKASALSVTGHSDFDVEVELRSEAQSLTGVFGHGLPFLQLTRPEGASDVVIQFTKGKDVRMRRIAHSVAIFSSGSRVYAAFSPAGNWKDTSDGLSSDLGSHRHFAIAALPDREPETIALFTKHAFAFVRDTTVQWTRLGGNIATEYKARGELVEPCPEDGRDCERSDKPLLALYPHQWSRSPSAVVEGKEYASPRGPMKLSAAGKFKTELTAEGLLPIPPIAPKEKSRLASWLAQEVDGELFPVGLGENPDHDAYWDGKSLGRVSTLAHIARAVGEDETAERLVEALKNRLADWFDGEAPRYFYYDEEWRSLMAFPDSYGSGSHLNDHHFHYGYFVHAAATIAFFDRDWASANKKMVEMLIRDVANPSSKDELFPRLRHMDPYAGHSWANGPAQFAEGNNEESSSEDINFSYAVALWGALTENTELEDLGLYLYATQVSAVEEYWFDTEGRVFPKGFKHPTIAMV